jgi:hypothetical protein
VEDDSETILPVACANINTELAPPSPIEVHVNEDRLFVQLGDKKSGNGAHWILDFGTTNHMMGEHETFSELNTDIRGTVWFDDWSMSNIEGCGTILLQCKNGEHEALTGVYLITWLTMNISSHDYLEEDGYQILLFDGCLKIWD